MNNQQIIEGFIKNDKTVILFCYQKLLPPILKLVKKYKGNEDDARNIIWKSFTIFRKKCTQPDFALTNYKGYIYHIAKHLWLQEIEKQQQDIMTRYRPENLEKEKMDIVEEEGTDLIIAEKEEMIRLFQKHLKSLPDICQEILRLKYQFNFPHEDIGLRLSISTENSRQRLSRCLRQLAKVIEANDLSKELIHHYPGITDYLKKYSKK